MSEQRTHFVTGAAGFIASSLTDRLLAMGERVVAYDNFSTGQESFLEDAQKSPNFRLVRGDLLDPFLLTASMAGCDRVWHLAANADIRFGLKNPRIDMEQNTIATANVLEAMRVNNISEILFSSSSAVYGDAATFPTPEDAPFPVQISLYGASKLAGEGLISSYCEGFGFRGVAFRFVSLLGERYPHGHVFDFIKKLRADPTRLEILGDGNQRKSYMYIQDCLDAMFLAADNLPEKFEVYNLGADEYCLVRDSATWICEKLNLSPRFDFTGGDRGWIGDSPFIWLDTQRIRKLGWDPKLNIRQAVERTVDYLVSNPWLMESR